MSEETPKPAATRRGRPRKVLPKVDENTTYAKGGLIPGTKEDSDSIPALLDTGYVIPRGVAEEVAPKEEQAQESSNFYEVTILEYGITFGSQLPVPGQVIRVPKTDMNPRSEEEQKATHGKVFYTYKEV